MVRTTKVQDQRDYLKSLYFGDGGSGKTTNLASLANLGRVLYIDAESGIKQRPLEDLGVKTANIELLAFEHGLSYGELDEAFWAVKSDLDDDPDSWVGVLWDSGTEIYQALLEEIVTKRVENATAVQRGRGKGTVSTALADRFFVDRDDYGENVRKIRLLMRHFRDLPCHFGSSFLERRDQDDRSKRVWVGPSISPSLQTDMIGWHDVVGHTVYDAASDLYTGRFRPEGVTQGKDRYGVLPAILVDPTMDRLVQYISGELEADSDPRQQALVEGEEEEQEPTEDEPEDENKPSALEQARAAKAAQRAGKE